MSIINVAGYSWTQRQSEAEYRLHQCFEFSGRYLTDSAKPTIPPAYKKASPDKVEAYNQCVRIAKQVPRSTEVVVVSTNYFRFTCSFYTLDPLNGNIDRVYWFTEKHRYYADV